MSKPKLLTTAQVAELANLAPETIGRYVRDGRLPRERHYVEKTVQVTHPKSGRSFSRTYREPAWTASVIRSWLGSRRSAGNGTRRPK